MGHATSLQPNAPVNTAWFSWADLWYWLKVLARLLPKIICIFDDIPFLLMQHTGIIGPYLLAGAGFIIFPIQIVFSVFGIRKALRKSNEPLYKTNLVANITTLLFSTSGLLITGGLLAFIILAFPVFAAASSIAIPSIMSIIGMVELAGSLSALKSAYDNPEMLNPFEHKKAVTDAARGVIFSSVFLGFGLAITALATLSVLSGLSVLSLGAVPSIILIAVVVTALALKIFEIADHKVGKADGTNHRVTNFIHRAWLRLTNQHEHLNDLTKENEDKMAHRNLHKVLNVTPSSNDSNPSHEQDSLTDDSESSNSSLNSSRAARTPSPTPPEEEISSPTLGIK